MPSVLDTFITRFRFETDRSGLKSAQKGLATFKNSLIKIGATIGGIFAAKSFFSGITERLDELGKLAQSIGVSVGQLNALQFAAKRAGVPINSLRTSLINLNKIIGATSRGSATYNRLLSMYGISIRNSDSSLKNASQLLKEINRAFQRLSLPRQIDLAQNLGIDSNTLRLLQQTPREYDALIAKAKELGTVTYKQTQLAAKFNDELSDLKQIFFGVAAQASTFFLPALIKTGDVLEDVLGKVHSASKEHPITTESLSFVLKALAGIFTIYELLKLTHHIIREIVNWFKILSAAFITLFSDVLPGLLAIPGIGEIVAGFVALFLLVQDFFSYLKGGRSVIGEVSHFIESMVGKVVQYISSAYQHIANLFNKIKMEGEKIKNFFMHPIKSIVTYEIKKQVQKPLEFIGLNDRNRKNNFDQSNQLNQLNRSNQLNQLNNLIDNFKNIFSYKPIAPLLTSNNNKTITQDSRTQTVDVGGITINTTNSNADDINNLIIGNLSERLKTTAFNYDSKIRR